MNQGIPQALSGSDCLPCETCCRFPDRDSSYRPYFLTGEVEHLIATGKAEASTWGQADVIARPRGAQVELAADTEASADKGGAGFHCPFLEEATHACRIYEERPLDCVLYPFMLALGERGDRVVLHLDEHCPAIARVRARPEMVAATAVRIEDRAAELATDPNVVADEVYGLNVVAELPALTSALGLGGALGLRRLRLSDAETVAQANARGPAASFARSFVHLYLHRERHGVLVSERGEHLFVVCLTDGVPWFPVAPLGPPLDDAALGEVVRLQRGLGGGELVHLPDVREEDRPALERAGFTVREEGYRVVAEREAVARLSGARFRAHRNAIHQAERSGVAIRELAADDVPRALQLWIDWCAERPLPRRNDHERNLAEEGFAVLRRMLHEREQLSVRILVAEAAGELHGLTAGVRLDDGTSVVLTEFARRQRKGVAPFLARELAGALRTPMLDLMDDSGLASPSRTKARYGRVVPQLGALRRAADARLE